jgi:carbon-monoxide dehydrogenase large subunit
MYNFFKPLTSLESNGVEGDTCGATASGPALSDSLNVEVVGPRSLLPHQQRCGLRFEADGTVTIVLGTRDYGYGWASPYFAGIVADKLGVQFERIRMFYTGVHPAARTTPRNKPYLLCRASVGAVIAEIGDLIEVVCDRVIDRGRHLVASSLGVAAGTIGFDASRGRFFDRQQERYFTILDTAARARDGRLGKGLRDAAEDRHANRIRLLWDLAPRAYGSLPQG